MTRTTLVSGLALAGVLAAGLAHAADYTVVFANSTTGFGTINLGNPHAAVYTVTRSEGSIGKVDFVAHRSRELRDREP